MDLECQSRCLILSDALRAMAVHWHVVGRVPLRMNRDLASSQ